MLIDIGANLTHESFVADLDDVLHRAEDAGVTKLIVTGASVGGSEQAAQLSERYPQLFSTAGIHPHEAKTFTDKNLDLIYCLTKQKTVVALGECGLDFNRDFSPRPIQEKCFIAQLELACELKMPVFMHERDAHTRFLKILDHHRAELNEIVVHCFTGNESELRNYLALDCHIGITGWVCDERRGLHLRSLINLIPSDRLMLETDCPYLLPRDLKPKPKNRRNEPAYLTHILQTIATLTNKTAEQLAQETTETAIRFFRLT